MVDDPKKKLVFPDQILKLLLMIKRQETAVRRGDPLPNVRIPYMTELERCLEKASAKGFVDWFKVTEKGLQRIGTGRIYQPEEVSVPNFFRFEGISDPDDMSILYEIETRDGCKGTLIDAYGVYSDSRVGEFMCEVQEFHKKFPHTEAGS